MLSIGWIVERAVGPGKVKTCRLFLREEVTLRRKRWYSVHTVFAVELRDAASRPAQFRAGRAGRRRCVTHLDVPVRTPLLTDWSIKRLQCSKQGPPAGQRHQRQNKPCLGQNEHRSALLFSGAVAVFFFFSFTFSSSWATPASGGLRRNTSKHAESPEARRLRSSPPLEPSAVSSAVGTGASGVPGGMASSFARGDRAASWVPCRPTILHTACRRRAAVSKHRGDPR